MGLLLVSCVRLMSVIFCEGLVSVCFVGLVSVGFVGLVSVGVCKVGVSGFWWG